MNLSVLVWNLPELLFEGHKNLALWNSEPYTRWSGKMCICFRGYISNDWYAFMIKVDDIIIQKKENLDFETSDINLCHNFKQFNLQKEGLYIPSIHKRAILYFNAQINITD